MNLFEEIESRGLRLPEGLPERYDADLLAAYLEFLIAHQERFFSKGDQARILERHLFESLVLTDRLALRLGVSRETNLADAGSGPGLPGYLLAFRREAPNLTLIDSSSRSLGLLEEFHARLPEVTRPRVDFRYARLEEMRGNFSGIIARALFPFPGVIELICHLQKPGDWFALAAANLSTSSPRVIQYLDTLGYVSRETIPLPELAFLGERRVYVFGKEKQTKNGFPRKWKRIKEAQQQWEEQSQ